MSRNIPKHREHAHDTHQPSCVFLVDDDPVSSRTATQLLRTAGLQVHVCDSPQALLSMISADTHGCVVLDARLSWARRRRLQQALLERGIGLPLIFVTDDTDVLHAIATIEQGPVEFLPRPSEPTGLLAVIERALFEHAELAVRRQAAALALARWQTLSPREQQVCRLCAEGLLNKQIAAELGTRESTVQAQRARALAKLGVSSAVEVHRLLVRAGEHE